MWAMCCHIQLSIQALWRRLRRLPVPSGGPPSLLDCRYSWRYRQLCLLQVGIYSFGPFVDPASGLTTMPLIWAFRATVLLLLLFCRDEEADFGMLEQQGAGMGLVVDAKQLSRALHSYIDGNAYTGKAVKRYKATLFRMTETLAVSYRWQPHEMQVPGLGGLNMSRWQIAETIKAIDQSKCLYVWIDTFAVPEERGPLKRALLSRMMTVYAASMSVVCLMSLEQEESRYHQVIPTEGLEAKLKLHISIKFS
eukprot:scaffold196493_cov41-Prasinocladus_malaysianus.AAC.2